MVSIRQSQKSIYVNPPRIEEADLLEISYAPRWHKRSINRYLLSSLGSLFDTRADLIVLWVTLAYAREYMIQHYAYAPVTKRDPRELSRYSYIFELISFLQTT